MIFIFIFRLKRQYRSSSGFYSFNSLLIYEAVFEMLIRTKYI